MGRTGKRYRRSVEMLGNKKAGKLKDAVELLTKLPKAKFDETIDIAVKLGVDPRKAEENVRGAVSLPHGTGKICRVLVFAKGEKATEAKSAGADYVGAEDLVVKIQEGWTDFDSVVATPDTMALVGRIGKVLGPRGLMPNPKVGTVTFDVGKMVASIKAGRVEYRVDKKGILHAGVGKSSFETKKIVENISSFVESVMKAKPKTSKGVYLCSLHISTTMGPSIELDGSEFSETLS